MTAPATTTFRRIFTFWLPLEATWLMMAVEGPFLAAVIARLGAAELNLAAYGVAFSFALIVEAPVIMMMSASTALVRDRRSFVALRRFAWMLNAATTAAVVVLVLPPVFDTVARSLVGLPAEVTWRAHLATAILIPWPAAIGYRRFYQGILIRSHLTRRVAYGTVVRLFAMAGTALACFVHGGVEGAAVGACALTAGVVAEAAASRVMVHSSLAALEEDSGEPPLSMREIARFYHPLALTSLLALAVHPLITFFMGRSREPVASLAVLPVVNALVFIFRSPGLAFQEVGIALVGERCENYRVLRSFAALLAAGAAAGLAAIAWTPLARYWFGGFSGLSPELTAFALVPARIVVLLPALSVVLSFQRAMLVHLRTTAPVTAATAVEVGGIVAVLLVAVIGFDAVGAVAAAAAFVIGRVGANLYLAAPLRRGVAACP